MMLVTKENLTQIVDSIGHYKLGLDTETFGSGVRDRLFSIIISDSNEYYFNFDYTEDHLGNKLPSESILDGKDLEYMDKHLFRDPSKVWYIHNAKFDLQKLELEGVALEGRVHCSYVTERILYNTAVSCSLAACAKRRGLEKDESVEKYINKHKLYKMVQVPGKKKKEKVPFFHKVPLDIMVPYGEKDALLHSVIGMQQERLIYHGDAV